MVRAPLHFYGRIPVPEVAPLTYRDGVSQLELVYELSQYLKKILHPSLQSTVDQVVADAEKLLSDATDQYVDGVEEFQRIHDRFMSDVNATLMALNDSAVSDLIDDSESLLGERLRDLFTTRHEQPIIENNVLFTVGVGGDFQTINEALTRLSRYRTTYRLRGVAIELRLLSGFVLEEQVFAERIDLGYITITSEDDEVMIRRDTIVMQDGTGDSNAFTARYNATLPVISALFRFDGTGVANTQNGIGVRFNSAVIVDYGAGVLDAPQRGINVQQESFAVINGADFSGAGEGGIRAANGSVIQGEESIANNCGKFGVSIGGAIAVLVRGEYTGSPRGIRVSTGSSVAADGANVSNSSLYGAYCLSASNLDFNRGIADNCGIGMRSYQDGRINAGRVVARNCDVGALAENGSSINVFDGDFSRSDVGIRAEQGSRINANEANVSRCGTGVSAQHASTVNIDGGDASNATRTAIVANWGSTINARYANARNSGSNGVNATEESVVNASNVNATGASNSGIRCDGATVNAKNGNFQSGSVESGYDMLVLNGGVIRAHGATGGISETANTPTSDGLIYR